MRARSSPSTRRPSSPGCATATRGSRSAWSSPRKESEMLVKTMRIAGLLAILAATGPSAQAATLLDSLQWENGVLILGFDGPFESRNLVMSEPDRIVLDFPGVRTVLAQASYPGEGALQRIRVGQNEPEEPGGLKARVVLDLASAQNFLTEVGERSLRVVLSPTASAAAPAAESQPAPSAPAAVAEAPAAPALRPADLSGLNRESAVAAPAEPSVAVFLASEDPAPPAWESAASPASEAPLPALIPAAASDPIFVASDPFEPTAAEQLFAELPAPPSELPAPAATEPARAEEPKVVWTAAPAAPGATPTAEPETASAPAPLIASAASGIASGEALFAALSAPATGAASAPAGERRAAVVAEPAPAASAPAESPALSAPSGAPEFGRELTLAAAVEELTGEAAPTAAPRQFAQAETPAAKRAEREPEPLLLSGKRPAKGDSAPITLEMRGAEFRTLLHAFSEFAGVNIVAGKEVQGKVSVHLTAVPWREALAAVCSANGYTVKEEYGVLRVAPRSSLLQEEMELLTAERKRSEYLPLETEVIKLSYAVAGELTEPLAP
ncbi:AMIN domain-containing protein, partial [bacterium]|nr:AMIN domain-containing protein [bacterium]